MNSNHPRFGQRLIAGGGALLVAGTTIHLIGHRLAFVAGALLTLGLVVRLFIEWSISGEERDLDLLPQMQWLGLLNQFSIMVVFFGLLGLMRER